MLISAVLQPGRTDEYRMAREHGKNMAAHSFSESELPTSGRILK